MGTRSTIALEFADGSVGQVYCHWDGYLSHNGKILLDQYSDPYKLRDLIDLGDVSSLAPEIGEKHPFSPFDLPEEISNMTQGQFEEKFGNMTTFYGRDRGEKGVDARYYKDFDDYVKNHQYEEYEYILRQVNGQPVWYVNQGDKYEPLMEAIIEEMRQEDEETV
jgi:hypothetical protein